MIVLDSSALIELLGRSGRGLLVEERLKGTGGTFHAPDLIHLEVLQVLRRLERQETVSRTQATAMIDALVALPLRVHAHSVLVDRIWALRWNVTAYDAAFLALAELLRLPLLTCDRRLASIPACTATVEVL